MVEESKIKGLKAAGDMLYDVAADQRMEFLTERTVGGRAKRFKVTHLFKPFGLDDILEFERLKTQKIEDANADEIDTADALAVNTSTLRAILSFYKSNGARSEGYTKDVDVDAASIPVKRDVVFAVDKMLLGMEFIPVPVASSDELCPVDEGENSVYPARCIFDGYTIAVSAALRPPTDIEFEEYTGLMNRTVLVQGTRFGARDQRIPSKAKRLIEFFDSMKTGCTGYASDRVAVHHRIAYISRHMQGVQKMIEGK